MKKQLNFLKWVCLLGGLIIMVSNPKAYLAWAGFLCFSFGFSQLSKYEE